jgi:hypothetical protein
MELLRHEKAITETGDHRWRIESPSALIETARTLRRADGVLEERLRAISWEGTILPKAFEKAPLVLVGLLALGGDSSRVEKLCRFGGVNSEAYLSVRRTLLLHNIIRPSSDQWTFDFQHDLLRLVAIEIGRKQDLARLTVERVLTKLKRDQPTASDLELCADLANWMGFTEDAIQALNGAYERLRKSENFAVIRRVLSKLCGVLHDSAAESSKSYMEYLTCRSALAWATWNSGSLTEARAEYTRITNDAMSAGGKDVDVTMAEAQAADSQRRIVGIDLALNHIPSFLQSAERALELNGDSLVFNSIMNRLILYCARFSQIGLGLKFSQLILQAFGEIEPESAGAVICSDIGALFRAASLEDALALYRRGVELATGSRQRTHNELDVLVTEVRLGKRNLDHEELAAWRRRLVDNGLRSMLSRFDMFCASLALVAGRLEQANRLYRYVETAVAVYRPGDLRLDLWNDQMITYLLANNSEEAYRLQDLMVARLAALLEQRRSSSKRLQDLAPAIERQRIRFPNLAPLELPLPAYRPIYSGLLVTCLLNLETLSGFSGALSEPVQRQLSALWPTDIDHTAAMSQFQNQTLSSGLEFRGVRLALGAQ